MSGGRWFGDLGNPDYTSTDQREVRKTDKEGPVGARALALVEGDD